MILAITMMMEMIVTWIVMMVKTLITIRLQYKPDDGITGDDYRGSDGKYDVNWKV